MGCPSRFRACHPYPRSTEPIGHDAVRGADTGISPYLPVSPRISPYLPVSPRISPQDTTRYAALMAWSILQKHERALEAIAAALEEGVARR